MIRSCCLRILLAAAFASGLLPSGVSAEARETIGLDGIWGFATDPEGRGEAEQWYKPNAPLPKMPLPGYSPKANGTIVVPGIWDNQGYGVENDKLRHHFSGKGWYKRRVAIPQSWSGHRVFLVITGISRYSKVWVDDHFLGEHVGSLSVQEYDVTPCLASGKTVTVTIQVDSKQRWEVDAMYGCSSLADFMDVEWGGIWGHVRLEARNDCWLSDLHVESDVANSCCSVGALLTGKSGAADAVRLDIFDKSGNRMAGGASQVDLNAAIERLVTVKTPILGATLWTPDNPTLYTARLSLLKGDRVVDAVETRFGMRHFTIRGNVILLNGKRLMLCGYGDDHIYPEPMSMPSDKELHVQRLRTIKSYGFNHVRHHSTIMPPEYYEACDEVGMIANAEFPICYTHFLPGTGEQWRQRAPKDADPAPANETFLREWTAAVKRHRNHPSLFCWVMGNEIWDGIPLRYDFQRIARQLDPGRFFADSDGVWGDDFVVLGSNILKYKKDRDTLDLYFLSFNVFSHPFENPTKFQTPEPPIKPVISHEEGNYVTFSRPDLVDQFQHNFKPFWLTEGKAKLERLGLLQEACLWAEKSERMYLLLHKCNIEALRKNPLISGYHWWLFQDYWTSSNGIVDHYFRPKSIPKEEVLKFNSAVVLLQDGLGRTYRGKDRFSLKCLVSNFSEDVLQGEFRWKVTAGDRTIGERQTLLKAIPQGDVIEATRLDVSLPELDAPQQVKLVATLTTDNRAFANDWTTWLYPSNIRPRESDMPRFADKVRVDQWSDWGMKPLPAQGELDSRAVYLVRWPCDPRAIDALLRGAGVIVLDGADRLVKSHPVTYRTSWWKAGDDSEANHTGTFVQDHPVTRAMAPNGWCDDGWFHLIEGGVKCRLEETPMRPNVIVRALTSMARVEDAAMLFEVAIGRGTLIVSGLNHRRAAGRPENAWLVARLIDRAAATERPTAHWPKSMLTRPDDTTHRTRLEEMHAIHR